LHTGRQVGDYNAHDGTIWTMAISPKGILATASDDRTVGLWDGDGKLLRKLSDTTRANGMAFSPDGSLLLTAGTSNTVDLWEVATGKKRYSVPGHGNYGGLRVLAFSPDGSEFYSFGDDFYFRRWRTANGKAVFEKLLVPKGMDAKKIANKGEEPFEVGMFFFYMAGAQFTQDAKTLVVATRQDIHLFDTATGNEVHDFVAGRQVAAFFELRAAQAQGQLPGLSPAQVFRSHLRAIDRPDHSPYAGRRAKSLAGGVLGGRQILRRVLTSGLRAIDNSHLGKRLGQGSTRAQRFARHGPGHRVFKR
jgi:WD40 repeat protein